MSGFEADLDHLQPSQLYISAEKLAAVEQSAPGRVDRPMEPLPVKRLDGRLVLTDGHTRAFAAFRAGRATVPVRPDTDELDWDAYRICVRWCLEAGIQSVADLASRVLEAVRYEELWLTRCREMQRELERGRE